MINIKWTELELTRFFFSEMKSQKVTKSSKYTQASPSDVIEYQNVGQTIIPLSPQGTFTDDCDKVTYAESVFYNVNQSSELLLKNAPPPPDQVQTRQHKHKPDIDTLCHCVQNKDPTSMCRQKTRFVDEVPPEQMMVLNRSFSSLPRLANVDPNALDRKASYHVPPRHTFICEQNQRILREIKTASLRRMQSPEIINIHRGPNSVFYDGYGVEQCPMRSCDMQREDYSSLKRGQTMRSSRRWVYFAQFTRFFSKTRCSSFFC